MRVYAPVLKEVGIDEATFLDFVDKLKEAADPNPWLNAINLVGMAGIFVPEPFTIVVSMAAQLATQAALNVHSRSKTNALIDQLNAEFFRPRRLLCLVIT